MNGVEFSKDTTQKVDFCKIVSLSEELKDLLRSRLVEICEGEYHSEKFADFFSYKTTLLTFMDRYMNKTEETQVGMIGELLCHLLFPLVRSNLKCMSPFYNLEEGSIKKGHDLLYCDPVQDEIWIMEVKSGQLGKAVSVNQKKYDLLNSANRDLQGKLTSTTTNLWRNALKGMDTTLKDGVTKKSMASLLKTYHDKSIIGKQKKNQYNVVLASSLFHDVKNPVIFKDLVKWKSKFKSNKGYNCCVVFSIQKSTFQAIIKFLGDEAKSVTSEAS